MAKTKTGKIEVCKCCTKKKGQRVSIKEFGKKLIVDFRSKGAASELCRVDGCLIRNATAPDYAISDGVNRLLLAELKGKDVIHALSQIEAGFVWWESERAQGMRKAAVVVCNEVPREQSRIQLAKLKFASKFSAPVRIYSKDVVEETFEKLMNF